MMKQEAVLPFAQKHHGLMQLPFLFAALGVVVWFLCWCVHVRTLHGSVCMKGRMGFKMLTKLRWRKSSCVSSILHFSEELKPQYLKHTFFGDFWGRWVGKLLIIIKKCLSSSVLSSLVLLSGSSAGRLCCLGNQVDLLTARPEHIILVLKPSNKSELPCPSLTLQ